jgi:SAM-dependent methyltransferase
VSGGAYTLDALIQALYNRVLGHPFVYEHIRPLVLGGVDHTPSWHDLAVGPDDVVLDVGCGTGDGLTYAPRFRAYYGFDTDAVAIARARQRARGLDNVHLEERALTAADLSAISPSRVMLCGLLHHLPDDGAHSLLSMLAASPSVKRVTTLDTTYLPGKHLNNLFTWLDRGRYPRSSAGYQELARQAGFQVANHELVPSHPTTGRTHYVLMGLVPSKA